MTFCLPPLMRLLCITCLCFAAVGAAATDYRQITTFTGPCAQELAVMAKEGDIQSAREQARALCRTDAAKSCPDLWLVYAHCEVALKEPGSVEVTEEVVRRLPRSAAAHMMHALAVGQEAGSGGIFRMLKLIGSMRRDFERAVEIDPDCHVARAALTLFYSLPRLLGGDAAKLKYHIAELDRRDPFHAALAKGALQSRIKNFSAAAGYYREAHRLDPLDHDPVYELIRTSVAMGDYAEAFELCSELTPAYPGDGARDMKTVELSARSGLCIDEALTASARFLVTAKGVAPIDRAGVMIDTAIILKRTGRSEEAAQLLVKAEGDWKNAEKEFCSREKKYQSHGPVIATR